MTNIKTIKTKNKDQQCISKAYFYENLKHLRKMSTEINYLTKKQQQQQIN